MCEFRVLVEEWITQWCDSDKTTIGCQSVSGVSASQQVGFWPSLNWPHQASAFCCYCYSIQGRIDKHKFPLWQMDFLWKQMGFLWKKQRCYPRISPTHTCTPIQNAFSCLRSDHWWNMRLVTECPMTRYTSTSLINHLGCLVELNVSQQIRVSLELRLRFTHICFLRKTCQEISSD